MIKTVIVENEESPAEYLQKLLLTLFTDIDIVATCDTVQACIHAIRQYHPDLIFLDVELNNNENGFDILKIVDPIDFEIIVTTSFDQYAIYASKASVIDYLLKPISPDELKIAIDKFRKRIFKITDQRQIEILLSLYNGRSLSLKVFPVPTMTGLEFVETAEIYYIEGAGSQSTVHFSDKREICINYQLKECEKILTHSDFCRIHKSYLINLKHIKRYYKGKDGKIEMKGSVILPISRDYKEQFLIAVR